MQVLRYRLGAFLPIIKPSSTDITPHRHLVPVAKGLMAMFSSWILHQINTKRKKLPYFDGRVIKTSIRGVMGHYFPKTDDWEKVKRILQVLVITRFAQQTPLSIHNHQCPKQSKKQHARSMIDLSKGTTVCQGQDNMMLRGWVPIHRDGNHHLTQKLREITTLKQVIHPDQVLMIVNN